MGFSKFKKLVPQAWLGLYHRLLAALADFWYGQPSKKLIVIGVTGTNGKTTTAYLLAKALAADGLTGCTTTALIKIGDSEQINVTKMTMPGRFFLQRNLRRMVDAGCKYAIIETSSQGLIQWRHAGIAYDAAVFTNLTPEHVEAHGGFENYKRAKRLLFEHLARQPKKFIDGRQVPRLAVLNADSPYAEYYAATPGLKNISWFSIDQAQGLHPEHLTLSAHSSTFEVDDVKVSLQLPGKYNVENALAVLAVCRAFGVDLSAVARNLSAVERVPGRFERVQAGQPWQVIVDYAPEPESLRRLYETLDMVSRERLIHVLGSCGGGRDVGRRPVLGRMAGEKADIVIVTNEDPYDDDPKQIMAQVARGAIEAGKIENQNLFQIEDRREAIFKAMALAQPGDLVLMTGKGCEPWICLADGKKLPWNECAVAREAILSKLANPLNP